MGVDLQAASEAYAEFLRAIGVEDGMIDIADSARHTAELMAFWMNGVGAEPPVLSRMPAPGHDLVSLRDLPFYSFCGHHFVPFFGTIQIDYIPNQWIAGLGGFSRVIDHFSHRPQFQENLCAQIAGHLFEQLEPAALRVQLSARQMCLELHGKGAGILVKTVKTIGDAEQLVMSC